jgi:hypothetical protein
MDGVGQMKRRPKITSLEPPGHRFHFLRPLSAQELSGPLSGITSSLVTHE